MRILVFLLFVFSLCAISTNGQENSEPEQMRLPFYKKEQRVSIVSFEPIGYGGLGSWSYDSRFKASHKGFGYKFGIGYYTQSFDESGNITLPFQLNYLWGKWENKFELGAGITVLVPMNSSFYKLFVVPTVVVAYRYILLVRDWFSTWEYRQLTTLYFHT